jgi:predicted MFS family arabinose efflux permease
LEFNDYQIGIFFTLVLLGDVFLGGFLTLIADRTGRRKVLIAGSLLMVSSGVVFAFVNNFWILLVSAIFGVVSVTGGDFGKY